MATGQGKDKLGVATNANTGVEGSGKGAFPPFQSETFASQMVSFAIAFVALYLIVSKIILPRVGGLLAVRENAIDADLAQAQKLKDESDAALAAYEAELAAARGRAQAIGGETRDRLSAQSDAERKTLEERLAVKLADAESSIAATRQSAMSNVRTIAADAAAAIVQRLTGVMPDAKAIDSAVDASLKG